MEDRSPRDQQQKEKHKVNSLELRHQDDDIDSDEVGLIVQHALSVRVQSRSTDTDWIVDSGATCHVCNDRSSFVELSFLQTPLDITLGDGHALKAIGRGIVTLMLESDFSKRKCKLSDVLYVPELTYNLLSVSKAVEKGVSFTFSDHRCVIKDVNQRLITVATKPVPCSLWSTEGLCAYCYIFFIRNQSFNRRPLACSIWSLEVDNLKKLAKDKLVEDFDYSLTKEI